MRTAPTDSFIWRDIETGLSGLVGALAVAIYDGDTPIIALTTTGVNEIDASGVYEATFASAPDTAGDYTLFASLDGTLSPDQVVTEVLTVTANAPFDPPSGNTYADATEFARILKITDPTPEQTAAMNRALIAASYEIDTEIDAVTPPPDLSSEQLALAQEVCLERANEHWAQAEAPFGLVGLGSEIGPAHTATDTWKRHAAKLAPLKQQWGLA